MYKYEPGLLIGHRKKSQDFKDKFVKKLADFAGMFRANFAE